MTIDIVRLRELAERAILKPPGMGNYVDFPKDARVATAAFHSATNPQAILELLDRLDQYHEALERVADHDMTKPGLHYDSVEQLVSSAVGIAKRALGEHIGGHVG